MDDTLLVLSVWTTPFGRWGGALHSASPGTSNTGVWRGEAEGSVGGDRGLLQMESFSGEASNFPPALFASFRGTCLAGVVPGLAGAGLEVSHTAAVAADGGSDDSEGGCDGEEGVGVMWRSSPWLGSCSLLPP